MGRPGVWGRGAWVAAGLLFLTSAAAADPYQQNPHLAAAQSAMDDGELEQAAKELQKALAQPDNSDDALVEIYKLQGIVALYQGKDRQARQALEKLFQVRPDYQLPKGTSPKIRDLFAEVQEDVRKRRVTPVTLEFEPISRLTAGGPAQLSAEVRDLPGGARVRLFYRRAGSEAYGSAELKRKAGDAFQATLPASELPLSEAPFGLEYYLEVDDSAGRRLAGKGDALSPLLARVRAPETAEPAVGPGPEPQVAEEPHWYEHWYVWAGVGVVAAAGAGTAVYFATRPSTGTLPLTITVTGP